MNNSHSFSSLFWIAPLVVALLLASLSAARAATNGVGSMLARWVVLLLLLIAPLLGQAQPTPSLSGLSPTSGSTGTSVVITGSNLSDTGSVTFPGPYGFPINASFVVNAAATQITVSVPAGALSGPITVTTVTAAGVVTTLTTATFVTDNYLIGTGGLTVCSGNIYDDWGPNSNYAYNHDYSTTISPATAGSKVRLNFTQFDIDPYDAVLYLYDGPDANAPLIGQYAGVNGPGVVAATNPTGQLTIRLANALTQYSTSRPGFAATISCVAGVPTISSFTPTNGSAGTSVVITGVNFSGTTAVAFNGTAASGFVVNSSTQITVPVPAGATSGPITVTNGNGTGSSSAFTTDNTLIGVSPITTCSGSIYDSQANYNR